MTREQAIAIAKAAAAERWTDHEYITDPYDARWADWMPHEWVIDAVMAATPAPEVSPENLPTKEHIRDLAREALDQIMEQAQVFASAWSLVGGRFDYGNALSEAHDAKDELRSMVRSLADLAAETVRQAPCAAVAHQPITYHRDDEGGTDAYASLLARLDEKGRTSLAKWVSHGARATLAADGSVLLSRRDWAQVVVIKAANSNVPVQGSQS